MREQPWQKRTAARAFHELRRTREQTENDARQRRIWNVTCRDVDKKFRPVNDCRTIGPFFHASRNKFVGPLRVAEFLFEQCVKIFQRKLAKKIVHATLQSRARKSGLFRAKVERKFAKF